MQSKIGFLKEKINSNSETVLIVLLIVFYLTESINKVAAHSNLEKIEIQAGIKALVFGLVLMGLLIYKKKELLYIAILSGLFVIGQSQIQNSFEGSILMYLTKYLFPIALLGFFTVQPHKPKLKLFKIFEYILLLNSILILVGLVADVPFFHTYHGSRFGYNGLMVTSAASTYFYIIGLSYFLARYQKGVVGNWKFWFIAIASMIVGTKSIMLVLAGLGFFYIIKYVSSPKFKLVLLAIAVFIVLGFGYYLFFINSIFKWITENEGVLTSFLSLRDQVLIDFTLPYIQENWNFWNYLFGGVSNFELRPQMEFIDVFFFWGILGGAAYLYFYSKSFFQYKVKDIVSMFILFLILIIIFLAGNFFYNTSVVIYVIILREALKTETYK